MKDALVTTGVINEIERGVREYCVRQAVDLITVTFENTSGKINLPEDIIDIADGLAEYILNGKEDGPRLAQ